MLRAQRQPVDETGLLKGVAGAAQIWNALEASGVPDNLGCLESRGRAVDALHRYPDPSALSRPCATGTAHRSGVPRWSLCRKVDVVVDDDIDAGELDQVLWAMSTRFDPNVDIDLISKAWASKRDPLYLPGNFNNRILIDACIPYEMKLKNTFPTVVDVSADLRGKLRTKFPHIFPPS